MLLFTGKTRELVCLASLAMGLAVLTGTAIAEKFDHALSKSNPRTLFKSAAAIGGPNHEVGVEMIRSDLSSSNPGFKVTEEWVYNQFDFVDGSGPHRGTFVDFHEDGSQTYGSYEGSQKTVANADGSWVATWEGKYRYTGGTGKYKNVKGSGVYKGKATSTGEYSENEKETIEY